MSYRSNHQQQVHKCGQPLCHRVIPIGQRYCPEHQKQHEQQWQAKKAEYRRSKLAQAIKAQRAKNYDQNKRDPEAMAFYHSKQWQHVRDYVYARDGAQCQVCGNILGKKAIDHIVPRRLCTPEQALDSSNLWTLCYKCHYRKTKLEQIISQQPHGDTKLKHLDRQWWTKVLREERGNKQ